MAISNVSCLGNNRSTAVCSIELLQLNGASQAKLNQGYAAGSIKNL